MSETSEITVPEFTKSDYFRTTRPFEWVYSFKENGLKMQQMLSLIREQAGSVGVKNFTTLFRIYERESQGKSKDYGNTTDFTGQPMELECGKWYTEDGGIFTTDKFGLEVVACNHPIMPIRRLVNIDTGIEKIELAYRKGRGWRRIIADKRTLASASSIVQLADYGIAVNSENAKHLVRYLTDMEHLNYDQLEEVNSVGRLGWIDDYGFSPYVDDLVFDGDISFKNFFESVTQQGNFMDWVNIVKEIRSGDSCARLMLAASFASVLVKPCGGLPFFVHLWGGTGSGKTVGVMLAASVWANPEMGRYIHTFDGTPVAQELSAGFVNSMPLMLDELQIVKDKKNFDALIYQLSEGIGRSRGRKEGGLQRVQTWQNCFLTSGEMPIGGSSSGGGVINRIIEIDCQDIRLFPDPINVLDIIKKNFGFAGRMFVDVLSEKDNMDYAVKIQKEYYKQLSSGQTTEKQALSASIILAADFLIEKWIFGDGKTLSIGDIEPYLSTKEQVSQNGRALQFLFDYVAINQNRFVPDSEGKYQGEIWGIQDDNYIYIIKSQFDKILQSEGYNPAAFLSWARQCNTIKMSGGKSTITKRIAGNVCRCVWIKVDCNAENEVLGEDFDDLPFD